MVLVAINQPFTIWILHSFFLNILKIWMKAQWLMAAPVSGISACDRTGDVARRYHNRSFSFLLAYNDYAVTSMLLSKPNETMALRWQVLGTVEFRNIMFAVSAVVSATAPLFVLVHSFNKSFLV